MHGEKINAYRISMGRPDRKRPLGRSRYRWMGITMNLIEVERGGTYWTELTQDRSRRQAVVNKVMKLVVPLKKKKKKLHGLSPRANYTDRATAASRRSVANLCG
jgi:hypothetical protein